MARFLKIMRWIAAALFGGFILIYFLDITGKLPVQFHVLAHLQIVPAIMAGMVGILAVMFVLTLLFGRIYCSVICPLGILQDFILRCKKWWLRLRGKIKKYRTKYEKPLNALRYGVFGICALLFVFGVSLPLLLLDPYSNFGRIAVAVFRPFVVWINNLGASFLTARGSYALHNIYIENLTWLVIAAAVAVLVILVVLVWRKERIWCNTMCPVGTLLGFVSRFSLFRITLSDKCNKCMLCAGNCKSRCIDVDAQTVDHSRCVVCFDCLGKCKKGALSYSPAGWSTAARTSASVAGAYSLCKSGHAAKTEAAEDGKESLTPAQISRRRFVKGSLMTALMIPASKAIAESVAQYAGGSAAEDILLEPTRRPLPPGAISLARFKSKCTACQLCISKCPTQVLQPAFLENGLTGIMQPYLKFRVESYCNYECTVCLDVCPNDALEKITLEQKKLVRIGAVKFVEDKCIVKSEHQDCGACAEHCPTGAVKMVPYEGTLTIPFITSEVCVGCGACESICPVVPPAIFVEGLADQENADPPVLEVLDKVEINDFGF